jgi:hypothetical protein
VTLTNPNTPQASFVAPSAARMSFRLVATDADGFRATSNSIDVRSNGTPTLAALQPITTTAGSTVSFRAAGSDPDNDPLTYSATGAPPTASFNTSSGEFSWPGSIVGNYTVTITASDGTFTSAPQSVTITVTAPQRGGGGGAVDPWMLLFLALVWLVSLHRRRMRSS